MGRKTLAVTAALAVVYVVWGSTYLGIAVAIETLPPFLMAAARFLLAGAILYPVAVRLGDRHGDRPGPRQWTAAFVTGAPLLVVGNGGVVWAQQTVPTGLAALIIASVPLWLAVLDRAIYGRRLSRQAVAGLALGFGGIAVLVDVDGTGGADPAGAAVLVLAASGWALGSLLSRSAPLPKRLLVAAAMQMLAGGTLFAVLGLATGEASHVHPAAFSGRSLVALGYLVVFGSIVAFSCYGWLLRTARTSLVGTYAYVNPVVAVLLGWAVLEEAITTRMLLAGGTIVAAVALIVTAPKMLREAVAGLPRKSRTEGVRTSINDAPA